MNSKALAVAAATSVLALLPATAQATTGGLYWSPDGGDTMSASLQNPQSGHCYPLRGNRPPFYASNTTNSTVHYYRSAGCSDEAGTLPPNTSGNVTQYVKFD